MVNEPSNIDKIKGIQEDYKTVFRSEEGKRVLAHLETMGFWNSTTISKDPNITAFNEGNRAFLLSIKTILNTDLEALAEMYKNQGGQ